MIVAPCAANESERLQALRRYAVLDTDPEADFDAITSLLAFICDVPIALVSLVDNDRQWFKSRFGLAMEETPRDLAFCSHALHQTDPMIVEDAARDIRFADNPLVTSSPKIRFYAGAPLITPTGLPIGTLCAIDIRPRGLTAMQTNALKTLARHVMALLELRLRLQETLRLNDEIAQAKAELEKTARYRAHFFATINHEMRTPLNAITGFSRRLLKRLANENVPGYLPEGLGMIESASRRLADLVDDVLDVSKMDAGKMTLEVREFALQPLLQQAIDTLNVKAEEKSVGLLLQMEPSLPEKFLGDSKKIGQVLLNLLSNAVKFTPPGGQVQLSCEWREGKLILVVSDEGIGIAPEDQQRIFIPFEQSINQRDIAVKGTGLGLSIVQGFVELMGGCIELHSAVGQGSTFRVSLPLAPA